MASTTSVFRPFSFVRRYFFDVQTIIRRSLSYACSLVALGIFFFGIEFIIEKFVYSNDEIVDILCASIGAFLFYFVRSFFDRLTDKVFFRKEYDYAKAINEIGPLLNLSIDLKILLQEINQFLLRTVKPDKVIFLLEEVSSPMIFGNIGHLPLEITSENIYKEISDHFFLHFKQSVFIQELAGENKDKEIESLASRIEVAAVVPLALTEEARALMLIGKRLSGGAFRKKDISLIAALSQQAGMAIRNARLYEEVRQYNDILEEKVVERTEKIRSMFESQSKFLTEVSHELQTPIAILRGNVEAMQNKYRQERENALRVIGTTVNDMARLIDNLLESARLKFSKNIFYKKDISMGVLLQEIHEDCSILAEDKGINISVVSEDLWVRADRNKLKEVLLNLISNALKHTGSGGSVIITAKNVDDTMRITVDDNGSGILPENLPYIFERFYKIENLNGPRILGTGIGLDICRQIVEAHGGTITAESEFGKGSSFIIQLPILL